MKWLDKRIKALIKAGSLDDLADRVRNGVTTEGHRHVAGSWTELTNEPIGPTALGAILGIALLDHWWRTHDDVTERTGVHFSMPILGIDRDWLLMRSHMATPPWVSIRAAIDGPAPPVLAVDGLKLVDRIPRIGDLVGRPYCILRSESEDDGGGYLVVPASDFIEQFPGFLEKQERSEEQH